MSRRDRLLVVDDEPEMLEFVARVFRRDHEVRRASTSAAALELLAAETFEVIVVDQRLPDGSGVAILEAAAARWPATLRVLLSGAADDEAPAAADVRLGKPVDGETLREAVEQARRRR